MPCHEKQEPEIIESIEIKGPDRDRCRLKKVVFLFVKEL
jgi:hypothetical protein